MTRGLRTDGIRTADDLRARCWIDDDTGCWHWRGAVDLNGIPSMWLPALRRRTSLGVVAAVLATDQDRDVTMHHDVSIVPWPQYDDQRRPWSTVRVDGEGDGLRAGRPAASAGSPARCRARTSVDGETPTVAAATRNGTPCAISFRPRSVAADCWPLMCLQQRNDAVSGLVSRHGCEVDCSEQPILHSIVGEQHHRAIQAETDGAACNPQSGAAGAVVVCAPAMRRNQNGASSVGCAARFCVIGIHAVLPVQAPRHAEPMNSNVRVMRTLRKDYFVTMAKGRLRSALARRILGIAEV